MSTTYPKIETLFDRGEDFLVEVGSYRRPEFALIDRWLVTEKVDGTNIRLGWTMSGESLLSQIGGRTDNAQIPAPLFAVLRDLCDDITPKVGEIMNEHDLNAYVLYGEGYGAKIQSGGWYREDQGFTLFDVRAGGSWLDDDAVTSTAERLGLERVPLLRPPGLEDSESDDRMWWTLREIVHDVSTGLRSRVARVEPRQMEGIVARPPVPLYDRRGERVMFKLKTKDFRR
jgi:ATP-dependent RNA circularization protein (DNA/RNA ligase family)